MLAFVEARYGEFVLLRPRLQLHTCCSGRRPLLLLLIATMLLLRRAARRHRRVAQRAADAVPLSAAEQQRLDELLKKPDA